MKHILIRLTTSSVSPLQLLFAYPNPGPPPDTKMSDPIPLTSLVFIPLDDHYRTHLFPETFYILKIFFSSLAHGTVPHTHIYRICKAVVFPNPNPNNIPLRNLCSLFVIPFPFNQLILECHTVISLFFRM